VLLRTFRIGKFHHWDHVYSRKLAGDAGVVEFAGEDFKGLAVEGEVIAFDGEGVSGCGLLADGGEGGEGENGGEEGADWRLHGRCNYSDRATVVYLGGCFKGRT
jgi:hypothetical protein